MLTLRCICAGGGRRPSVPTRGVREERERRCSQDRSASRFDQPPQPPPPNSGPAAEIAPVRMQALLSYVHNTDVCLRRPPRLRRTCSAPRHARSSNSARPQRRGPHLPRCPHPPLPPPLPASASAPDLPNQLWLVCRMQAIKNMVKQQSVVRDGDDSGADLIGAVHAATPATSTKEVQHSCQTHHAGCVACLTRSSNSRCCAY